MELKWDLSNLFSNTDAFYQEIELVKESVQNISHYKDKILNAQSLFELLNQSWGIKRRANTILVYGSLRYYKNVHSEECIQMKKVAESLFNQINLTLRFVDQKIIELGSSKIDSFFTENAKLATYSLVINNLLRKQKHVPDHLATVKINDYTNKMQEELNLYNSWLRDISYGTIEIDDRQVELSASNVNKYLASRDRETRKQTYLSLNQSFKTQEDDFAKILNSLFHYRILNAQLENYSSVLEKELFEENIDPKIIDVLIQTVSHHLPLMQEYLSLKVSYLQIDDPHLYDFGVPLDQKEKVTYTLEEAITIILEALKPLGQEYLDVVLMLLNGHVDAMPDENKHQSITFSWWSYSFLNFKGSYGDLKNLIHELGHIVNYYLSSKKQAFPYMDSTVFVGETASIVNEILLNQYLYRHANSLEEKLFYLSKEIENFVTSVFKQTMYTEFENKLYSLKNEQELTPEILASTYAQLLEKYYGPQIVYDDLAQIEWTRLGKLYRWSYYPYKYATGLLIASAVVHSLNQNSLFKEEYLSFLASGSSLYSLDLLKMIHIDFSNTQIIEEGFKVMEQDIRNFESLLRKKSE